MESPVTDENRRLGFIAIVAASALVSLDLLIVNLAFSSLHRAFPGVSSQTMAWVINAYTVVFAALLMPAGRLADRYGRRRLFRIGFLVFTVGSAVSVAAPDISVLIFGRGLQGAGAALLVPSSLGLLLAAYPKSRQQQIVSIWAAVGSVAAAFGPTLGGLLVQIDWRLIFLINIPIAIPALFMAKVLPETELGRSKLPDITGSLFLIVGIGALVTGLSYVGYWRWGDVRLLALFGAAVVLLALFVSSSRRAKSPAINLALLRVRTLSISSIGMGVFYAGFAIMLLGTTLYFTQVWGWPPALAGLAFGIGPATSFAAALIVGKLKISPIKLVVAAGAFFLAAGIAWLFSLGAIANYPATALPGLVLAGAAAGIAQTGFIAGGTWDLQPEDYSAGTGILNTARQLGSAIGVAILISATGTGLHPHQFKLAWILLAFIGALVVVTAVFLRKPRDLRQVG
jgi:MFS family permease